MVKGRVTETVLQILNTYRKRGMQEPSVVGRELAKLAMDPDLSMEHKVKIGVMKGKLGKEGLKAWINDILTRVAAHPRWQVGGGQGVDGGGAEDGHRQHDGPSG